MLTSIQILRTLAAWLVVGHHIAQIYPGMRTVNGIATAFTVYGAFGVDLFFVISGFVIYTSTVNKTIGPLEFVLHRVARVVPAYWFFTMATAAILVVNATFVPATVLDTRLLIKSLFFIPAENGSGWGIFPVLTVGWTLNFEMVFYLIYAAGLAFPRTVRLPIVAAGIAILYSYAPRLGGSASFYANPIIFEFLLGIAVGIVHHRGYLQRLSPSFATALALGAAAFVTFNADQHSLLKVGTPCALIVASAIALEPQIRLVKFSRHLAILGGWSYSTYLVHVVIVSAAAAVSVRFSLLPQLTIPIAIAAIAAVSWASHTYIEIPSARAIRQAFGIGSSGNRTRAPHVTHTD